MTALPTVPSALLRVALKDLKACEADAAYRINMGRWHSPSKEGFCEVCMAGAVIAQSLEISSGEHAGPRYFPDDVRDSMYALNLFRVGYVDDALRILEQPTVLKDRDVVGYEDDPEEFHIQMNKLANDLEEAGL